MWRFGGPAKAPLVQVICALAGLLLVIALYVLLMQLTVHRNEVSDTYTTSERDAFYAMLHFGLLIVAVVAGFVLGKWLNGLGIAYATLFLLVVAVAMVLLQVGGHTLACRGHNDLLRHWTC